MPQRLAANAQKGGGVGWAGTVLVKHGPTTGHLPNQERTPATQGGVAQPRECFAEVARVSATQEDGPSTSTPAAQGTMRLS